MSYANAIKYKMGRELKEWIHFGITAGARKSVQTYRGLKLTDPTAALYHLRRAVDMPHRANVRIDALRQFMINSNYAMLSTITTESEANQFLIQCLQLNNTVTAAELTTELTNHLNYASTVKDQLQANMANYADFISGNAGVLPAEDWTILDQAADSIESHYDQDIVRLWNFSVDSTTYVNIFGTVGDF